MRSVGDFPSPGIQFKDITPLLADASLVRESVSLLIEPFRDAPITKVVAIESRGFILGAMIAEKLDVGFVPVRKKGKLPWSTVSETYDLEYGSDTIEMHSDAIVDGDVVLIHDDVIATGGTAAASARLVERCGGTVVGYSFLIELAFLGGRGRLSESIPCASVITYD
ncbi:MAG: adenine phosphoribosyltransferase [Rhodothermales bacterium]|nr:adenine phosphoribosyltransferase [Rhodothermales bacterium]